jgi:hypothetical protein
MLRITICMLACLAAVPVSAEPAPDLGHDNLFFDLTLPDIRTAPPAKAADVYPYVTGVAIADDVVSVGEDTLAVEVAVYNPSGSALSGARVMVEIREPGTGYVEILPNATATLAAGDTTVVTIHWEPTAQLGGLQYEVVADVTLPFDKAPGDCEDRIINGTFDSGCGGWTLVENYPPTLGAECTFGSMEVYTSIYNTTHGRRAMGYQYIPFESGWGDWLIQFRTRYTANDGIYGYGIAYSYVYFVDSGGSSVGGYVQWASTVGAPADDGAYIYDRIQEGVWHTFQLDVGALASQLTMTGTPVGIVVGGAAMPYCSLSYCNPSASVFLDDVALLTCRESAAPWVGALAVSNLGAGIIGDREAILADCYGGDPTTGEKVARLIPVIDNVFWFEDLVTNTCAAGVHMEVGDNLRAGMALGLALEGGFRPALSAMSLFSLAVEGVSLVSVSMDLTDHLAQTVLLEEVKRYVSMEDDDMAKAADHGDRVAALRDVAVEGDNAFRHYGLAHGPLMVAIEAAGAASDADSVRHLGALVFDLPDSVRQLVAVADTLEVLADGTLAIRTDPVTVRLTATDAGTAEVGYVHQNAALRVTPVTFAPVTVAAGDVLTYAPADTATVFLLNVDRGGDGSVDEVVTGQAGVSSVPRTGPPPAAALHALRVEPNPFNPRTWVTVEHAAGVALRINVYDLRGRLVRTLHDAPAAGPQTTVVWDGADEGGQAAASGVYFVEARVGNERRTRKVAFVR